MYHEDSPCMFGLKRELVSWVNNFQSSVSNGALPTCNNEKSIHHLEESIGHGEANHLDQLLGSERELQHGETHLNILGSSF